MKIVLEKGAILPRYAHEQDACCDIFALEDTEWTLSKGFHTAIVRTGIRIQVPYGYVALIYSRSGQGFKQDISLSNGTGIIDSGYTGEVLIKLVCSKITLDSPAEIKAGQAIGQMMLVENPKIYWKQVEKLVDTDRSEDGFGSSDNKY